MTAASAPPRRRIESWGHLVWGAALVVFGVAWLLDAGGISVSYPAVTAGALIGVGLAMPVAPPDDRGAVFGLGLLLTVAVLVSTVVGPAVNPTLVGRGIGELDVRPADAAQVQERYAHGVGDMVVDLRSVTLPAGLTAVRAELAVGDMTVRVPRDATVEVVGDVGLGEIVVFGRERSGVGPSVDQRVAGSEGAPTLRLTPSVGIGRIEVTR